MGYIQMYQQATQTLLSEKTSYEKEGRKNSQTILFLYSPHVHTRASASPLLSPSSQPRLPSTLPFSRTLLV